FRSRPTICWAARLTQASRDRYRSAKFRRAAYTTCLPPRRDRIPASSASLPRELEIVQRAINIALPLIESQRFLLLRGRLVCPEPVCVRFAKNHFWDLRCLRNSSRDTVSLLSVPHCLFVRFTQKHRSIACTTIPTLDVCGWFQCI